MTSTPYRVEKYQRPGERERILRNNATLRARNKAIIREAKSIGCQRCGFQDIRALEFHHRDPSQKSFGVSQAIARGLAKQRILDEIAKCEVICANCHAIEHFHE